MIYTTQEPLLFDLLLGLLLSILSSVLFGLGIVLQKKGVMDMPELKLNDAKSMTAMLKSNTWKLGLLLTLIGGIPFIFAQGLIGVTLAQPLMIGLQLAFVIFFAVKILQERLRENLEKMGLLILLLSPVFLVLGSVTPPESQIGSVIFYQNLLVFLILSLIICTALLLLTTKIRKSMAGILFALISGLLFAIGANINQIGVEILKQQGLNSLIFALICFLGMLVVNAVGTVLQQFAFQKGKVGIAIGLQSTANLLLSIYGGLLIFNQSVLSPGFFIAGVILIILSNILLIRFQTRIEHLEGKNSSVPEEKLSS